MAKTTVSVTSAPPVGGSWSSLLASPSDIGPHYVQAVRTTDVGAGTLTVQGRMTDEEAEGDWRDIGTLIDAGDVIEPVRMVGGWEYRVGVKEGEWASGSLVGAVLV